MFSKLRSARVFAVLLVVSGGLVIGVAGAGADAPDPVLSSTTGTVVTNADGSRTVTVQGGWQWTTHTSNCNEDKRAVGFAVDWNDPAQAGNVVTTLDGRTIDVGAAASNAYNPADNLVHHTGSGTDSANTGLWRGGCGTYNPALGYNGGEWGPISHTYAPSFTGQITICALMYDVHLASNGGAPHNASEITAGGNDHNSDNSAEKNKGTPLGNGCFATTINSGPTPNPGLTVVKYERLAGSGAYVRGPIAAQVGQTVEYEMVVTNTGNVSETVHLADAKCDAGTLAVTNAPSETIAPGASIAYGCSHKLVAGDVPALTNVAIATAKTSDGTPVGPVSSQVVAAVEAVSPGLGVVKTQRLAGVGGYTRDTVTAHVGQTIEYQIVVTNTGNIAETVRLADAMCDAGSFAGANASSETVAPGASLTYTCSHKVVDGDLSPLTNVAIANATAANGAAVGPVSSQVSAAVQAPTAPKGVQGASKTVKQAVEKQAKPARAKVKAARFTG